MADYSWLCEDIETLMTYTKDGYTKAVLNQAVNAIRKLPADVQLPRNGEFGWLCDPKKNTECDKRHCYWLTGGECRITAKWEYATDGDKKKYPKEDE